MMKYAIQLNATNIPTFLRQNDFRQHSQSWDKTT